MDALVVCRNSDDCRLLLNAVLHILNRITYHKNIDLLCKIIDFDSVLRLRRLRVKAVEWIFTSITWGEGIVALKHGKVALQVPHGFFHVATFAALIVVILVMSIVTILSVTVDELLLREW